MNARRLFQILVIFLGCSLGPQSWAQTVSQSALRSPFFTGQSILDALVLQDVGATRQLSTTELLKYSSALGYVLAVFDDGNYNRWNFLTLIKTKPEFSAQFAGDDGAKKALSETFFCPPSQVSNGQLQAVVVKYLKANPALWGERAGHLAKQALMDAFPCTSEVLFPK